LLLLAIALAKLRNRLPSDREAELVRTLQQLPATVSSALGVEAQISGWAESLARCEHAMFLGRGIHYPIALEGALKLKEIAYVHAEGCAAGELKHGPLALVEQGMPVIALAPQDAMFEKLKSNLQEVRARGGELYVLTEQDAQLADAEGVHVIRLPGDCPGVVSPIAYTVPLQLLAYHTALVRGTDVDRPRNLAKSVTVE